MPNINVKINTDINNETDKSTLSRLSQEEQRNLEEFNTLKEIKSILERNEHFVKSKMGTNYSDMKDISKRL